MILENENFKLALNSALHKTDVIFQLRIKYEKYKNNIKEFIYNNNQPKYKNYERKEIILHFCNKKRWKWSYKYRRQR